MMTMLCNYNTYGIKKVIFFFRCLNFFFIVANLSQKCKKRNTDAEGWR